MTIEISLFLGHDPAVVGEHVPLRMLFTNLGEAPITVPDPERSRTWPRVIARDLDRGTETVTHRTDVEDLHSHEFKVPLPESYVTLGPREQVMVADDLLRWVPPLGPGRYGLAVWLQWDGGEALSRPVTLTVEALHDVATAVLSAHSGVTPNRYVLSAHDAGGAVVILLSLFSLDPTGEHEHPDSITSSRLAAVDHPVRPFASVTANGLPYPAHWVAWFDDGALTALFERQGRVELAPRALPWECADARFAAPILHDLRGNDGSAPGRALLAWWSESSPATLSLGALDADASLDHLGDHTFEEGALHAVHAWLDRAGAPAWLALRQARGEVLLALVRSATEAPVELGRAGGTLLASAVTLLPDDGAQGAMVLCLAREHGVARWGLQRFTLGADGALTLHAAQSMTFERVRTELTEARVAVSPQGEAAALVRDDQGEWWLHPGSTGGPSLLSRELPTLEAPDAITWMQGRFYVVTTAPEQGVRFHALG